MVKLRVIGSNVPTNMKNCLFCKWIDGGRKVVIENENFKVFYDGFPVNKGHLLAVPKRHIKNLFELNQKEWESLRGLLQKSERHLDKKYSPDGFNIGVNIGEAAGQTVFHLHIHLIPRYKGDVKNPRGGIRNIKKALMKYDD